MKLLYTHPNLVMVAQARSALELAGIRCTVRNEYAGSGTGELAPIDTWPELWVITDKHHDRAKQLLTQQQNHANVDDWQCKVCGAMSPSTFELCWQCAAEKLVR